MTPKISLLFLRKAWRDLWRSPFRSLSIIAMIGLATMGFGTLLQMRDWIGVNFVGTVERQQLADVTLTIVPRSTENLTMICRRVLENTGLDFHYEIRTLL